MRIKRATPLNELLAKIIFLLAPALLICYFILWNFNQYYTILHQQYIQQTIYIALGMVGAALFYSFRFRFVPTFIVLCLVFYFVYKGIDASATGEFDAFFVSIQFLVFAILFTIGWLIGWGFIRLRYFPVFIAALFLISCVILIAKQSSLTDADTDDKMLMRWLSVFGPVVLFTVYVIFAAGLIRNYKDKSQKFWWYLVKRLSLFLFLGLLTLAGVIWFNRAEIKSRLAEFGGGAKNGKNSLLKQNKDGTFDLEQYTRLRGSLSRSNELLFAAHIDNFFPGTEVPNPLYLTAFYYSKFDTATETFERDSVIPDNDLFNPDLTKVPLYFTKYDSSVLRMPLAEQYRKTVEVEVYKKSLSPSTFVAPSTSFFVQPIAIEKDFQQEFKSAYRAKSYISDLNSAYFVYNIDQPVARRFQEQRFEILRQVKDYGGVDPKLMRYYTYMPSDVKFHKIKDLAEQLTQGKTLPVDKVLAIRDYFLSKDDNGQPLFKYTDNPGIPDIPSASKLMYFLFENRKGYCAYYAGATLFMLRALGIPSRITVGFLTEERGSKIPGWYWYYADQAHAWVQVYFPGYGWLDFDTTVGNDDARQSPQPDGTPPMQPPKAYLAAHGVITSVDTLHKLADMRIGSMVYHDREYTFAQTADVNMDMSVAAIYVDSTNIALQDLKIGDSATAISFAEAYKNLEALPKESASSLLKRMPAPAPIDELHLKSKFKKDKTDQPEQQATQKGTDWKAVAIILASAVLGLIILFFLLPGIIYTWYRLRYAMSKHISQKAYRAYRTAGFYLHQVGYPRGSNTPLQHAQKADALFDTQFTGFIIPYLKMKYAQQPLTAAEEQTLGSFLPSFLRSVRRQIPFGKRLARFFRVLRAFAFFGISDNNF